MQPEALQHAHRLTCCRRRGPKQDARLEAWRGGVHKRAPAIGSEACGTWRTWISSSPAIAIISGAVGTINRVNEAPSAAPNVGAASCKCAPLLPRGGCNRVTAGRGSWCSLRRPVLEQSMRRYRGSKGLSRCRSKSRTTFATQFWPGTSRKARVWEKSKLHGN